MSRVILRTITPTYDVRDSSPFETMEAADSIARFELRSAPIGTRIVVMVETGPRKLLVAHHHYYLHTRTHATLISPSGTHRPVSIKPRSKKRAA